MFSTLLLSLFWTILEGCFRVKEIHSAISLKFGNHYLDRSSQVLTNNVYPLAQFDNVIRKKVDSILSFDPKENFNLHKEKNAHNIYEKKRVFIPNIPSLYIYTGM